MAIQEKVGDVKPKRIMVSDKNGGGPWPMNSDELEEFLEKRGLTEENVFVSELSDLPDLPE
jgi:hypothetical protein